MHEKEQTHESEGATYSRSHLVIMMLCCLIPIVLILVVISDNIESTYLPIMLVLSCPLLMLMMQLSRMLPRKRRTEENHY